LRGQRWVTVLVSIRPVRPRVVTSNVITPRSYANLIRLPLLVLLDLPVVPPDHTEQISHGPLTFKDRMALPRMSVLSIHDMQCHHLALPFHAMHWTGWRTNDGASYRVLIEGLEYDTQVTAACR
jgi:hypothetical protein